MTTNEEAARRLRAIADLLDVLGERFKPEAYRRAARSIEGLGEELTRVAAAGTLDEIPGVGAAISEKLKELLRDGRIAYLERLEREIPPGLVALLNVPGIGPKTVRRFWTDLSIEGPAELLAAIDAGRLNGVAGFGPTKIRQIRTALLAAAPSRRIPILEAARIAEPLAEALRTGAPVDRLEIAGSYRRGRETVGDLDLLATSAAPAAVFDAFDHGPSVASVVLRGPTKETVRLKDGLQVDLRVVPPESFGAALQYFTGSKDHNVRLRTRARGLGLKVNEYGVFRGDERVAGATEAEVYRSLGLPEIPPELREDRGEIEAAEHGNLPRLVELGEVRADDHIHLSDGKDPGDGTLRALAASATAAGLAAVGLVIPVAHAAARLPALRKARDAVGEGPTIRFGIEGTREELAATTGMPDVDYRLLRGGSAPPAQLPEGPPVLAAVHLDLVPSGGSEIDPGRLGPWVRWAAERRIALEVGPSAPRDGLDSAGARMAREGGARLSVTSGGTDGVDPLGLAIAVRILRRGGTGAADLGSASGGSPGGIRDPRPSPSRRRSRTDP